MPCVTSNNERNYTMENNIIKGERYTIQFETNNIGKLILDTLNEQPNHVVQIDTVTRKKTTFSEMRQKSIRCAQWMQSQNIGSGDVIALCTHLESDTYIPLIATFLIGAIYNPWHYQITLTTARDWLKMIKPKMIFTCVVAAEILKEAVRIEKVDTRIIVFGKYPGYKSLNLVIKEDVKDFTVPEIEISESLTAMIMFTSGTTGCAKASTYSYKSILSMLTAFKNRPTSNRVFLYYSPLCWISGTLYFLHIIMTAATLIIHTSFDPTRTSDVIEKYQVNQLFLNPSHIVSWVRSTVIEKIKLESLSVIFTGGSPLNSDVVDRMHEQLPHTKIFSYYGLTEIAGSAFVRDWNVKAESNSLGFITPNVEAKVLDIATGELLEHDTQGELCLKSMTMMTGYYENESGSNIVIDKDGWLHTGDKVYYDEKGEFYFVDRIKEVMKYRGYCISPTEIEDLLMTHPGVLQVAVVPIPDIGDGDHPMAFVRKCPGIEVTNNDLISLTNILEDSKRLRGGVIFLDEMPLTPSGKIDRKILKAEARLYGNVK